MASKSFLYSNAFTAKSGALSNIQKCDEQTDKETDKKINAFGRPGGR